MTAPLLIASAAAAYNDAGGTENSAVTPAINTTGAKRLLVALLSEFTGAHSVTDSKGNTYTTLRATEQASTYPSRVTIFISQQNPNVGAGHTFTGTSSYGYPTVTAWAIADQSGGALTFETAAQNDTASPINTPALTASAALLLAFSVPLALADLTATWANGFAAATAKGSSAQWQAFSASRRVESAGSYAGQITLSAVITQGRHYLIAVHEAVADVATIKRWNGEQFKDSQVKYWNGSAWADPVAVRVWNGDAWVEQ